MGAGNGSPDSLATVKHRSRSRTGSEPQRSGGGRSRPDLSMAEERDGHSRRDTVHAEAEQYQARRCGAVQRDRDERLGPGDQLCRYTGCKIGGVALQRDGLFSPDLELAMFNDFSF